jgi:two-component system, NtrC family, response regulator GlrR
MHTLLILNGTDFTPCSNSCDTAIAAIQRAHQFDRIHEASIASAHGAHVRPDLIVLRFLKGTQEDVELCAAAWPSVKTFGLFCNSEQGAKVPPAVFDVDEFLFCPFDDGELLLRLSRLLRKTQEAVNPQNLSRKRELDSLIGRSEVFLEAVRKLRLLAQSKAPVLISGETGSGKELFARAIHYQSARNSKPFIPINCGALPDDLFENELFGHTKGAYTHALSAEKGLIAEAEGGTLFLDEVDTLSLAAQVKLLRFLQSGEYRPLGAPRSSVANVRIIAATNADLRRHIAKKLFREDLHYRLNVLSLSIPPLRDRAIDVIDLAKHFIAVYAKEHSRSTPLLSEDALAALSSHSWPGNVRELEGVIQRTIVLSDSETLTAADLHFADAGVSDVAPQSDLFRLGKVKAVRQFERTFIATLLAAHSGNISRAAKAAGKDRRSFQRLVNKYSLNRKSFESPLPLPEI